MNLKGYIEKLEGIKVDKDNLEEVRSLLEGARTKYTDSIEEVEGNNEKRNYSQLRSTLDDLEQLKGLLESAEGLVDKVKEEVGAEEESEGEEQGEGNGGEVVEQEGGTAEDERKEGKVNKEERGVRDMKDKEKLVRQVNKGNGKSYRELFNVYLQKREVAEGLTTDSEGVILKPEEIMGSDYERTEALDSLVNVVPVRTKSGKHYEPDLSGASAMKTVEELAKSPEKSGIGYVEVDFDVETYREAYRNSNELKDDMPDFDKYIVELTDEVVRLTKNKAILDAINNNEEVETKVYTTVADFVTPGIKSKYRKGFVISETKYNQIARLKDSEGRFLLHNDLTQPVGKTILGYPVVVREDEEIGADTAIFGDLKSAVTFFDRQAVTVKWVEHQYWGTVLQPVLRFDVKVVKPEAIIKIDFNLEEDTP